MPEKTWQERRDEFWQELDIYNDDVKPGTRQHAVIYSIMFPHHKAPQSNFSPYHIYVEVDEFDLTHISDYTYWYGKRAADMSWQERKEVLDFLCEWELIELRQIGPEDSEYFATDLLLNGGKKK